MKGFVEATDPAVNIAKAIIEAANAAQKAIVAGIETGIRTAKDIANATKQAAMGVMTQIEAQVQTAVSIIPAIKSPLDSITIPQSTPQQTVGGLITIDIEAESLVDWIINAESLESAMPAGVQPTDFLDQSQIDTYNDLVEQISELQDLQSDYAKALDEFNKVDAELKGALKTLEDELAEAKKIMRDIFQSPFLLPGLWSAMIPSMMPLLGGLMPPPFPGGPPSTIPGMIYIAIMFIDAFEEAQHQEYLDLNDVNCEDEL